MFTNLQNSSYTIILVTVRLFGRLVDIFFLWSSTEEEFYNSITVKIVIIKVLNLSLNTLKQKFNSQILLYNIIRSTFGSRPNKDKLNSKLYIKPTNNKQYLHFSSSHPLRIKKIFTILPRSKLQATGVVFQTIRFLQKNFKTYSKEFLDPKELITKEINSYKLAAKQYTYL